MAVYLQRTLTTSGQHMPTAPRTSVHFSIGKARNSAYHTEHWLTGLHGFPLTHWPGAATSMAFGTGPSARAKTGSKTKNNCHIRHGRKKCSDFVAREMTTNSPVEQSQTDEAQRRETGTELGVNVPTAFNRRT